MRDMTKAMDNPNTFKNVPGWSKTNTNPEFYGKSLCKDCEEYH